MCTRLPKLNLYVFAEQLKADIESKISPLETKVMNFFPRIPNTSMIFMNSFVLSENPPDALSKLFDSGLKVSEFELQLRYYVHFPTNIYWERYVTPAIDKIVPLLFFNKDGLAIK